MKLLILLIHPLFRPRWVDTADRLLKRTTGLVALVLAILVSGCGSDGTYQEFQKRERLETHSDTKQKYDPVHGYNFGGK